MRPGPGRPVLSLIDEVPGREGKGVEVLNEGTRRGPHRGCERTDSPRREREAGDIREIGKRVPLPPFHELEERPVRLAEEDGVRPGADVEVGSVRGVRAVHGDARPGGLRVRDHLQRGLAPPRRAHLRQEVEIVLEQPDDRRSRGGDHRRELLLARREHRVEERDLLAGLTEHRSRDQGRERRVRPHLPDLLGVVYEEVWLRQENRTLAHVGLRRSIGTRPAGRSSRTVR